MIRLLIVFFLAASPVFSQEWKTDLDEAFDQANATGKNVLLFFSVSEACDLCRRLDHDIFGSGEFRDYANQNLILVKLDFRNGVADKSEQLLIVEKYNKDGFFPWVVVVNRHRKVIGKLPLYDGQTPRQYVSELKAVNR